MSGGVDSSVAAVLLQEQGYHVVGVTLQLWDYETVASRPRGERGCCDITHQMDARFVCAQIGIDHVVLDLRERFSSEVVRPYERAYLGGITPNPCVACNSRLKWGAVLEKLAALELDYMATGHYAQLEQTDSGPRLRKGLDPLKDQSYALWQVPREALLKTILPLGSWTKAAIREKAASLKLRTALKPDSQEVCFIPEHYGDYLREAYPEETAAIGEGEIIDQAGQVVGRHDGYFRFTIGQRRGLNISDGQGPYYVTAVDSVRNRVFVGGRLALKRSGLIAAEVNWSSLPAPKTPTPCTVKIRYNDRGVPATLSTCEDGSVDIQFDTPQPSVTPGQSAVWYSGDILWGGGIIRRAIKAEYGIADDDDAQTGDAA